MVMPVPAYSPAARRRPADRPRARRPGASTRTPSGPSSTSTGWPRCSPPAPAPCCSPSRTTRGAGCSPAPSSRACATSSSRHGARVISDEIHAPLVLPGAEHVLLPVAGGHRRPRRRAGRRQQGVQHRRACGARRSSRPTTRTRKALLRRADGAQRLVVARSAWSPRWRRTRTATRGWPRWSSGSTSSAPCSASCSPSTCRRPGCGRSRARTWPGSTCGPTATPTRPRSASSAGGCGWRPGHDYQPGLDGHVRLNIATSPDRLTEIVRRLACRAGVRRLLECRVKHGRSAAATSAPPTPPAWPSSGTRCSASRSTRPSGEALAPAGCRSTSPASPSCSPSTSRRGRLRFTDSYEEAGGVRRRALPVRRHPAAPRRAWAPT